MSKKIIEDKQDADDKDENPSPFSSFKVTAHLNEGGTHYKPGDVIQLTPDRAACLGPLVSAADPE